MQTFKKLLFLLTARERKHAGLLLLMIIIMALIDMIGVASILPFMAVITNPILIETNYILNFMFQSLSIFGVKTNQQFIFILGLLMFTFLVISLGFKALTTYAQVRFVQMCQFSLSKRMLEEYLHQPYNWFLELNSSELSKNILSESGQVVANGLGPCLEIISKGIVSIALIVLLILIDPKLALIVGLVLSLIYGLIFNFIQNYLNLIGKNNLKNNRLRFKLIGEAFTAIKEVKVRGLEKIYIKLFSKFAQTFHRNYASSQLLSQLPRFILEVIAFGGILIIILYLISKNGNLQSAIPIISLYVLAGYRLLPALSQIYGSSTQLAFTLPLIDKLYDDRKNLKPNIVNHEEGMLSFNKIITLKDVHYNYPNSSRIALKNINLSISTKSTVGFVGETGSGKTTIIDIILGLLQPQKGRLTVDGKIITEQNSRSWQRSIGYVPQHIYLTDDTIAANIAFGVNVKDIDQDAVEKASKIANLHNFVVDELSEKYQTMTGERGIKLSGGQRQRIGIARALYYKPKVLIFDESTSALDNKTEKVVMESVYNLNKEITIIIISHRLTTIKNCDNIFRLNKGELVDQGTYEELFSENEI